MKRYRLSRDESHSGLRRQIENQIEAAKQFAARLIAVAPAAWRPKTDDVYVRPAYVHLRR
jgi:hypothetical protein